MGMNESPDLPEDLRCPANRKWNLLTAINSPVARWVPEPSCGPHRFVYVGRGGGRDTALLFYCVYCLEQQVID
jgi:hypothetical protein